MIDEKEQENKAFGNWLLGVIMGAGFATFLWCICYNPHISNTETVKSVEEWSNGYYKVKLKNNFVKIMTKYKDYKVGDTLIITNKSKKS